jgi:polyisoprenoid-binding protein YceI
VLSLGWPWSRASLVAALLLDSARFPTVTFTSKAVSGGSAASGAYDLAVVGELSLHGVTRTVSLPLQVQTNGDALKATGRVALRQTDYGIGPVSVAGLVKVRDELTIDYVIVATTANP